MRSSVLKAYYDRSKKLVLTNKIYAHHVSCLFNWLLESDEIKHDATSSIFIDSVAKAETKITANERGIIAGLEEVAYFFPKHFNLDVKLYVRDGDKVHKNTVIANLQGPARELLRLERTILNILQRLSGIATETGEALNKLKNSNIKAAATRKTHWGWLDKKAVAKGGGLTHRLSLKDRILVKDNHIECIKESHNIKEKKQALSIILEKIASRKLDFPVEIEVDSQEQAVFVAEALKRYKKNIPIIIMFDNFTPRQAGDTVGIIRKNYEDVYQNLIIELSGGINTENASLYKNSGADVASLGSLTHSPNSLNISMDICKIIS